MRRGGPTAAVGEDRVARCCPEQIPVAILPAASSVVGGRTEWHRISAAVIHHLRRKITWIGYSLADTSVPLHRLQLSPFTHTSTAPWPSRSLPRHCAHQSAPPPPPPSTDTQTATQRHINHPVPYIACGMVVNQSFNPAVVSGVSLSFLPTCTPFIATLFSRVLNVVERARLPTNSAIVVFRASSAAQHRRPVVVPAPSLSSSVCLLSLSSTRTPSQPLAVHRGVVGAKPGPAEIDALSR
jgi:hypothetical protein